MRRRPMATRWSRASVMPVLVVRHMDHVALVVRYAVDVDDRDVEVFGHRGRDSVVVSDDEHSVDLARAEHDGELSTAGLIATRVTRDHRKVDRSEGGLRTEHHRRRKPVGHAVRNDEPDRACAAGHQAARHQVRRE